MVLSGCTLEVLGLWAYRSLIVVARPSVPDNYGFSDATRLGSVIEKAFVPLGFMRNSRPLEKDGALRYVFLNPAEGVVNVSVELSPRVSGCSVNLAHVVLNSARDLASDLSSLYFNFGRNLLGELRSSPVSGFQVFSWRHPGMKTEPLGVYGLDSVHRF